MLRPVQQLLTRLVHPIASKPWFLPAMVLLAAVSYSLKRGLEGLTAPWAIAVQGTASTLFDLCVPVAMISSGLWSDEDAAPVKKPEPAASPAPAPVD